MQQEHRAPPRRRPRSRRRLRGGRRGRERQPARRRVLVVQHAPLQQQAAAAAAHQAVDAVALRRRTQHALPRRARSSSLRERHRLLRALDALDHLVGGVVVERGAGPRQADDDAGEEAVHHRQHPLGPVPRTSP